MKRNPLEKVCTPKRKYNAIVRKVELGWVTIEMTEAPDYLRILNLRKAWECHSKSNIKVGDKGVADYRSSPNRGYWFFTKKEAKQK